MTFSYMYMYFDFIHGQLPYFAFCPLLLIFLQKLTLNIGPQHMLLCVLQIQFKSYLTRGLYTFL